MKIALCILNWNGESLLKRFLPSVVEHSPSADLYLIDNHSTDESVSWVNTHFPAVQIIHLPENYGYSGGYNKGLKDIKADLYCLMNSDIRVTQGWLIPMVEAFEAHENLVLAQPLIKQEQNPEFFEYAGAAGGFIDAFGFPYCRGRILNHFEKDTGQYCDSRSIFWASGACLWVRSECFWALGGFDEDFFAHQEEIDLCWRARNRGHEVGVVSSSEVFHLGGATLPNSPQKLYLNFRNSLWMLHKNLPSNRLYPILFLRMVWDGLAGIIYAFKGEFQNLFAVLRAHRDFYRKWGINQRKRNAQKQFTPDYFHYWFILWAYFVLKRSKFSQLKRD